MQNMDFLANGGEVGALLRRLDWSDSPLGLPSSWPRTLQTTMEIMLQSRTQMFLVWGSESCLLYNDAYVNVLGQKHPAALGRPMRESWAEVWDVVQPLLQCSMAGEALYYEDHPFTIYRHGQAEQAWFNFSYTPLRDDAGQVAGVLCILTETTHNVIEDALLKEETRRLYQLFEDAPGFIAILHGPDHVYDLTNQTYLQLIGHRECLGKTVREALPELEGQGFFELLDKVYATGEPFVGDRLAVQLQTAPGNPLEERFVNFIYQPIRNRNGIINGIFVQGSDVTDQVHTESKLKEAVRSAEHERDRLNAILNTVPVAIVMVDAHGKSLAMNAANFQVWGEALPLPDSVSDYEEWKGWWANGTERQGQRVKPHEWPLTRALNGEKNIHDIIEIEPFGLPGVRRTLIILSAPIYDAQGSLIGGLAAQMDITQQVQAESALRESEARFRAIANSMPQLVWSNLPDGEHDYYNDQWKEFTGLYQGLQTSDDWTDLVHPEDRERAAQLWQTSLNTGVPYEIEYRLRHKPSGEYRWLLARALPVRDDSGKIIRWMGTCTDIRSQKQAAEDLKLTNQRKDEFLAMLAHELRNPLAPISAAAELMELVPLDEAGIKETSRIITRQVDHMTELVDDLLDVSRVTRGLVTLEKEPVDIKSVINSAIEQSRPLIEKRNHALHLHLKADNAMVFGDRTRLVQVLANLLNNAAKYTPQGGDIELRLEVMPDQVQVSVTDSGIGIDPTLLPHVFELFTQGERTPDRSQGGLGLGLALVKSMMDLHNGHVAADSKGQGKGSTFKVCLPIFRLDLSDQPDLNAENSVLPFSSRRLMLVDDNMDAAQSLAALLKAKGHQVVVKENALSALKAADSVCPEVYILDIGLPDLDGYELARRLRALPHTSKATFIALTGYNQAHDKVLAKFAGFDHYFVKPVNTELLDKILEKAE